VPRVSRRAEQRVRQGASLSAKRTDGEMGRRRVSGQLEFGEEDRTATLGRAWELALHLLASKVSPVAFGNTIQPLQPLAFVGNVVTFGVSSAFFRERVEKNYANPIRSALEFHLDTTGLQIVFVVMSRDQQRTAENKRAEAGRGKIKPTQTALPLDEDTHEEIVNLYEDTPDRLKQGSGEIGKEPQTRGRGDRKTQETIYKIQAEAETRHKAQDIREDAAQSKIQNPKSRSDGNVPPPTGKPSAARVAARKAQNERAAESLPIPSLPLNDRYQFQNFLVGRSNRLAHAGATGVAERPGEVYNPLFLYGGPGLGKTHLMQGIAHSIRQRNPDMRIAYVSGEYFAQHYITAIRDHATEDFRRQYREVDVWLVDDIQFVAGKEHTKEEFFHTFNTLYQGGKQIVIASDRSPRELNTMDERLRSRFQSGLIADISAPELETRIAILQQCRQREGFLVENDVLEYIASAIQSNMRALEGALTKLVAYSSIHNAPATAELAQSVLSEYFIDKPVRSRKIGVNDVIDAVVPFFGVTPDAIRGPNRNKDVSLARQVAMYLSRELLPELNTTDVGAAFGSRDHATIVYACQRIRGLMDMDAELKTLVTQLQKKLAF
jgi:chromosomal replication initiator protein